MDLCAAQQGCTTNLLIRQDKTQVLQIGDYDQGLMPIQIRDP